MLCDTEVALFHSVSMAYESIHIRASYSPTLQINYPFVTGGPPRRVTCPYQNRSPISRWKLSGSWGSQDTMSLERSRYSAYPILWLSDFVTLLLVDVFANSRIHCDCHSAYWILCLWLICVTASKQTCTQTPSAKRPALSSSSICLLEPGEWLIHKALEHGSLIHRKWLMGCIHQSLSE